VESHDVLGVHDTKLEGSTVGEQRDCKVTYTVCGLPVLFSSNFTSITHHIYSDFGSFAAFQEQFTELAANHFGSGWVWLVQDNNGRLSCRCTHDAGNPMTDGYHPLLTIDVWEHSYYLQYVTSPGNCFMFFMSLHERAHEFRYRHDRPTYIRAWWNVVNWNYVEERLRRSKL
jgi:Fe-Mn family superoxide dismutase